MYYDYQKKGFEITNNEKISENLKNIRMNIKSINI